jgi:lipoprotein-anchoring transpeptidase ErfK/SrfK
MRLLAGAALAAVAAGGTAVPAASARKQPVVKATQQVAAMLTAHRLRSTPRARPGSTVSATRPITGAQTVLPVLGRTTTADGVRWLQVRVPGRPNGRKGWITQRGTVLTSTSWHVVVRTAQRRVRIYHAGRLVRSFAASVGKPSTPTPHGRFFVEESVRMLPGGVGGPYALALSARSNVLQEFAGGPGQIAIHGVANLGGPIGVAISHGCVRLANSSVQWLAGRIPPGAPVSIRP